MALDPSATVSADAAEGRRPTTTVAASSSDVTVRGTRCARARSSATTGACASLVSTTTCPPGANQRAASPTTRRSTASPSRSPRPAQQPARGGAPRAGACRISSVGTYGALATRSSTRPRSASSSASNRSPSRTCAGDGRFRRAHRTAAGVEVHRVLTSAVGRSAADEHRPYRAGSAAEVDDHWRRARPRTSPAHHQLGATTRDEHARPTARRCTAELHPADHMFQRLARPTRSLTRVRASSPVRRGRAHENAGPRPRRRRSQQLEGGRRHRRRAGAPPRRP